HAWGTACREHPPHAGGSAGDRRLGYGRLRAARAGFANAGRRRACRLVCLPRDHGTRGDLGTSDRGIPASLGTFRDCDLSRVVPRTARGLGRDADCVDGTRKVPAGGWVAPFGLGGCMLKTFGT